MTDQKFDSDLLYNKIVHFYVDKKNYSKKEANAIAQAIIKREIERRICKNLKCRHSSSVHIKNSETCLVLNCQCQKFVK